MLFWTLFAALLCVAYSRHHVNKHNHSDCSRGFKRFDKVCLKTYHYATDYDTAHRKCHRHGSHLIRGTKEELNKMVKKMQTKKMIENTKYWTSSYGLDENSVWFHRFDPKDFAMIMSVDGKNVEERVESRSKLYKFICQKYPRHGKKHSKSKFTELKEKKGSQKDQGDFDQEKKQHGQTNIEIKEILSEGQIVNELGFEDDESSTLTSSEASELSSQQSSEASDLSSQQSSEESDLSSQQSSLESDLSSQQSSEASDLSSQQSDLSSQHSSEESDLSSQQSSLESDLSSQQSSLKSDLKSEPSTQVSAEFEELEEESDKNPDDLLSEEQTSEGHNKADDLDEQTPEDDGPEEPWHEGQTAEDHGTKEHDEVSASVTAITPAVFLLPLVYIVSCILN